MTIQILYDNQTTRASLESGWGFSCLIDGRVLFDTGESGPTLLKNFNEMDIAPEEVDAVIISHPHWDHTGGLKALRGIIPKIPVYLPQGADEVFPDKEDLSGADVTLCPDPVTVGPVQTTGTFVTEYKGDPMPEHGVVVQTPKGVSLITGCAHPGILVMARDVAARFPKSKLHALLGGFHLMNADTGAVEDTFGKLKDLGFERIIATHCSGEEGRNLSDYHTGAGDIFVV